MENHFVTNSNSALAVWSRKRRKRCEGGEVLEMAELAMGTTGHCFLEFPANPEKVPDTRQHIRDVLISLDLADEELIYTAQLIATEFVANAVKARDDADRRVRVSAYCSGDYLVVEAWDNCAGAPRQQAPTDLDEGGRGLWLIDMLSHRWGYHRPATGGKVVWAEVPLDKPE
jgi:anti-sigma regulatory factor (Ser/Thr protein kinase)